MLVKVLEFAEMAEIHAQSLLKHPENYKVNNSLALALNTMWEIIIFSHGVQPLINLANERPHLRGMIAIQIRDYESVIAFEMYQNWYLSNKKTNWVWKFILDSWDEDQLRIEDENRHKIDKYKQLWDWEH